MTVFIHGLPAPQAPDTTHPSRRRLWAACWRGEEPAETLALVDGALVEQLFYDLWALGWTDAQIAQHTRHTTYTVARIRARLGLAANTVRRRKAVA